MVEKPVSAGSSPRRSLPTSPPRSTLRTDRLDQLTGFQRDLLYVIAGVETPHGLGIKDEVETYYEKEIHHGRLTSIG